MKKGECKQLIKNNGRYIVDVGITVDEWKEMINNPDVFYPEAKAMILQWYFHDGHQATSKEMMSIYSPQLKASPYNGIVMGLAKRVLKHLNNRFWVKDTSGQGESFFCIPFEGWYDDFDKSHFFVWKLRDELVQAIDENEKFRNGFEKKSLDVLESFDTITSAKEGRKQIIYTTKYERSSKNRDSAIKLARLKNNGRLPCGVCGFDFEKTYGELGKDFIEVHHTKPLHNLDDEVEINPETDLVCICANCHRMIHRYKNKTLTIKQLKKRIKNSHDKPIC